MEGMEQKFSQIMHLLFGDEIDYSVSVEGESISVKVEKDKVALIIGKEGRNAKSLREMLYLHNKIHSTSYTLSIEEKE
jgi:predicted RNA-binding protein YlqC (UPF0109 family)